MSDFIAFITTLKIYRDNQGNLKIVKINSLQKQLAIDAQRFLN